MDGAELKEAFTIHSKQESTSEFMRPLRETGLSRLFPKNQYAVGLSAMRLTCWAACDGKDTIEDQVAARKACAASQDPRYHPICHNLEGQAHVLYVLGYLELERPHSVYRLLAWYMLSIAAGLGQLDAALLLHQLHKADSRYTPGEESRALIARAAAQRLDWRAMVAHCEHNLDRLKLRRSTEQPENMSFEQCLGMLVEAIRLTRPTKDPKMVREAVPEGMIDAEALMTFDPPHELVLEQADNGMLAMMTSDQVREHFRSAALLGATLYKDGKAAWFYAQSETEMGRTHSDEWLSHMQFAASGGIPEAAFELAKYYLQRDGWYPSVTARVLKDAQEQDLEYYRQSESAVEAREVSDAEKHERILASRNEQLLDKTEGLSWMKTAAELHADNPIKALNRYLIIAGLFRQNGLLEAGRNVLMEASESLRDSFGDFKTGKDVLKSLAEYLENWDTTMVHQLLNPDQLDPMLNP